MSSQDNNKSVDSKDTEPVLFPKKEWDSLIKWRPVSNLSTDPYEDVDEKIREYHRNYVRTWLNNKSR